MWFQSLSRVSDSRTMELYKELDQLSCSRTYHTGTDLAQNEARFCFLLSLFCKWAHVINRHAVSPQFCKFSGALSEK